MSYPDLLTFWKMQRAGQGLKTIIKECHKRKAEALTDLVLGKLPAPNLMILEPPRVGKTDLGVKAFTAWAMSFFPDSEFIEGSWGYDLAVENTKAIRETFVQPWYRSMCSSDWGATVEIRGNSASGRGDHFFTKEGGSVKAVGMGQGVIGFGAGKLRPEFGGCISIDDPIRAQDANSKTVRERCNRDYHTSFESRRNRKDDPMTPVVLDMQRLNPGDLAGHLLGTERHRWVVVQIPAIDENGQSIWEERISLKELEHMKEYDPDTYFAQYMQQPSDAAFSIFKNEWWRFWTNISEVEKKITLKIITADTAFKAKDSSDFTVFQCWGFEGAQGAYLIDQVRGKFEFPELVRVGKDFLKKHTTPRFGIAPAKEAWVEDRASGTSLVQTLQREGLPFREWLPPVASQQVVSKEKVLSGPDKVSRAKQVTIPIYAGRVYLPYPKLPGFKWVENFVQEHSAFSMDDSHLYDDQVDGETMALLIWQQRGGGNGPIPQTKYMTWEKYLEGAGIEQAINN